MTTSSETRTPSLPRPSGDHWLEMTATLDQQDAAVLDQWITEVLSELETKASHFSSPKSRGERLARA